MSKLLVLCYHAVSRQWPAELSVTPRQLEQQLELLVARGYRGTTFSQALADPGDRKALAVTFDDSYRSVYELAFPILDRLGLPGTVFVPTAFPDREEPMRWPGIDRWIGGPHEAELRCMSWDQLRGLAQAGWEIGSHTHTHKRLTALDDAMLESELRDSRARCETELGRPCPAIAYPYGDVDGRVVRAARSAGYVTGAGLSRRLREQEALLWPRVGIYHKDTARRFGLKVSPFLRGLRASPLWSPLATAQRASSRPTKQD